MQFLNLSSRFVTLALLKTGIWDGAEERAQGAALALLGHRPADPGLDFMVVRQSRGCSRDLLLLQGSSAAPGI